MSEIPTSVPTYRESDLELAFDDARWIARRYDAHPFYRRLSAHGYAGVDFLLLHRREPRAVWVEVKNYRARFRGRAPAHLGAYAADPSVLAAALLAKERDTARGLRQIARHYRERWWWRPLGWPALVARAACADTWLGRRARTRDPVFFTLLERLPHAFVAHLALDEAYDELPDFDAEGFVADLQARGISVVRHRTSAALAADP